jgi:hypothetical protein
LKIFGRPLRGASSRASRQNEASIASDKRQAAANEIQSMKNFYGQRE